MKKILVAVAVLVLLLALGLAVFLATFDADRYRPVLVQKISETFGHPVRLGKISLGWRGGIALELNDLQAYPGTQAEGEPALRVEKTALVLQLLPLFLGSVQLGSVTLVRPAAHVVREPGGNITLEGITPPPAGGASAGPARAVPFLIRLLEVQDGTLQITDRSVQPPLSLAIRKADLSLRNVSLTGPISVRARLALFRADPNIRFTGLVILPVGQRPAGLKDADFQVDLSGWNQEELVRAFPAIQALGLKEGMAGELQIAANAVSLDLKTLDQVNAHVRLKKGRFSLEQLSQPVQEVDADADLHGNRLELRHVSGKLGTGSFSGVGTLDQIFTQMGGALQGELKAVPMEWFFPPAVPGQPALSGRLTASFQGSFRGATAAEMAQSFSGETDIHLDDGRVARFNLLREVFGRLTVIPGLMEKLLTRLPESYREKLNAPDTLLRPVEVKMVVAGDQLTCDQFRVATDTLELEGSGRARMDGSLSIPARVKIEPQLSVAILHSVEELRFLADEQGRLVIPVEIQGKLPQVAVLPDVSAVGQEAVGTLLEKLLDKKLRKKE